MDKIFFHIDANCFFASCEETINNNLKNKAFVVANNHAYAIISCPNKLARKYGIKAAMSIKQAKSLYNDISIVEPHYDLYTKKSKEIFNTIKSFCKNDIEIMSIDECFVDVSFLVEKYHNNCEILAHDLKQCIKQQTGINVCIGAGNSKFLAKMASDMKPLNNFAHIFKNEIKDKLWNKKIDDVFMVGKKTADILHKLKIETVIDFLHYDDQTKLKRLLKKRYEYLINAFNGNSNESINACDLDKTIGQSITLNELSDNYEFIVNIIRWLNEELNSILINRQVKTNQISINIKFFDSNNKLINKSKTMKLVKYSNDCDYLFKKFIKLFDNFYENQKLKLIGLSCNNIRQIKDLDSQNKLEFFHT